MRVLFSVLSAVLLASCSIFGGKKVEGDGNVVSQPRPVAAFTTIEVEGAFKVRLRQESTAAVKVETDANLQEYVEVTVSGNRLVVKPRDNYNLEGSRGVVVYVSAPSFEGIDVSGASEVVSENTLAGGGPLSVESSGASIVKLELNMESIDLDVSGAGMTELKGQTRKLNAQLSGASDLNGIDLITIDARVDLSGASKARLNVNRKLDAEASGASEIQYKGAAEVKSNTSGASSVNRL